ncbi:MULTISPECIES: STAS domain-containing protein [Edaphocola]|jgi:anti-anti-sigma regulatory factor|uniref:STAS domain-containing protein n=1 Tax=Edaphocola TaxID=2601681 RepID=UPI00100A5626|nr:MULTISPECIES: STAS domain-containing protein [Edaphocola]
MKVALEIKPAFIIITPEGAVLNNEFVAAIESKTKEGSEANSGQCYIVDLSYAEYMENEALDALLNIHENVYEDQGSIVFTNLQESVMQKMKQERLHLSINIATTMAEAVDFINHEIMERGLLNEL